jgi:hypothetical protein
MVSLLTTVDDGVRENSLGEYEWHTKALAAKSLEEKVQAAVLAAQHVGVEKLFLGCIGPTHPVYPRKIILEALDSPETTTKLTLQCLDEGDEGRLCAILPAFPALEEICFYDCRMEELPISALLLCKSLQAIKVVSFGHTGSYGCFVQHLHFELINMPSLKSIEMKTHGLKQPPANVFEEGCANISANILGLAKEWFNGVGGDGYRSLDMNKKVAWDASLGLSPSGRTPSIRREVRKLLMGQGDNRICFSDGTRLNPWQLPLLDTALCELLPSLKMLILDVMHDGTVRAAYPKIFKLLLSAPSLQLDLLVFNNEEESEGETIELSSSEQISNFCNGLRAEELVKN